MQPFAEAALKSWATGLQASYSFLLYRNQSQPRHAIAQTRYTKIPESPPEWALAQEQPQGKLLLTCPPFCWMAAFATLACL